MKALTLTTRFAATLENRSVTRSSQRAWEGHTFHA